MPRRPRVLSNTGIYHIMIRGINRMDIFKTHGEKDKFLATMARMKTEGEYTLYGYCIMDNHVHLLIKEEEPIDRIIKRINVSYAYYYNKKYERIGPLFQGRFRSERIETEEYLLSCLRYIHNNPVKANIIMSPAEYKWSSYNSYISKYVTEDEIISREFILGIFSENKPKAIKAFINHARLRDEYVFIDDDNEEEEVDPQELIENILDKHNLKLEELSTIKDKNARNIIIEKIKNETNISIRELSRIIGISRTTIARIIE